MNKFYNFSLTRRQKDIIYALSKERGLEVIYEEEIGLYGNLYHGAVQGCVNGAMVGEAKLSSFEEIMDTLLKYHAEKWSVKLNDKHTAVITKDGVTVGCTTFTHAAVLEVAAKIKELQS
jgi:hypothetical protein